MKKMIVLLLVFAQVFISKAQTKESVFTAMAADLCKEIKSKEAELKSSNDLQVELGLMMMPVFLKYEDDLKKAMPQFDVSDNKQVQILGVEVGKKLIACPEFLSLMSATAGKGQVIQAPGEAAPVLQLEGIVTQVSAGDFTSIYIKTASGKVEKIWWMEYFPGDTKLANGSLLNKAVKIKYTEKETYNAALKEYIKIKIAAGLE